MMQTMKERVNSVVGLSSPWVICVNQIRALFAKDPEVTVEYDEYENAVTLKVDNKDKADALAVILPTEKVFGNITLRINVVPNNTTSKKSIFDVAFAGNEIYDRTVHEKILGADIDYVIFSREVISYWADDISDYVGAQSVLAEDLARDIFNPLGGVNYCTDCTDADVK